jgi:hypothetical protein
MFRPPLILRRRKINRLEDFNFGIKKHERDSERDEAGIGEQ